MTKKEYIEQVFSQVDHLPNREAVGKVLEHLLGEIYELKVKEDELEVTYEK